MNNLFKGKNIAIGIITLAIGIFVAVGIAKAFGIVQAFGSHATAPVSGNVAAFVLNPEGRVDGAILDTGDQVIFGAQTGEIVTANLKIGDALSATGRDGSKSDYGRELHAETLQIGGQTITVVNAAPKPPRGERGGKEGGKPRPPKDGDRPEPKGDRAAPPVDAPDADAANQATPPSAPAPKETASASGKVRFVGGGARGEARGVILASGEQIDLPKEVKNGGLTLDQNTDVSASGEAAKSSFGTFIKPTTLTVGNQTFSFNH